MNKSAKISMLVLAIVLAVGGVLIFLNTIVSPPGKLEFENQYVSAINRDIQHIKSVKTDDGIDSVFTALTHEINFLRNDSMITKNEKDELLESFVIQYVPVYTAHCNKKFQKSVWNEGELRTIQSHISELHKMTNSNGAVLIGGEANASLNKVNSVITQYYEAKSAAAVSGFHGLQSARQKITNARHYASLSPINNCTELVNKLNNVAVKLEQAHFSYLRGRVEKLRYYYNYSENSFYNLAVSIDAEIDEYRNNAYSTYGRMSDVNSLQRRADYLYENAYFYD